MSFFRRKKKESPDHHKIIEYSKTITGRVYKDGRHNGIGGVFQVQSNAVLTLTSVGFVHNWVPLEGGAIFTSGGVIVDGSLFENNRADRSGGAIYLSGGSVRIKGKSNFCYNNSDIGGGAIYNDGGTVIKNDDGTAYFKENFSGVGGAIYNNKGVVIFHNSVFDRNKASYHGGAIYNDGGGTCSISNSTFICNAVTGASTDSITGGAISNGSGTVIISGSSFSENYSIIGGAIHNGTGTVSISGSTLSGNTAGERGGAIHNGLGTVSISGSTLKNNVAGTTGGAIYNTADGIVSITNSIFSENSAYQGGAIYNDIKHNLDTGAFTYGTVSISGSTFTYNIAESSGGAINNGGGTASIINSFFRANEAIRAGGAINNGGGIASITNSIFTKNTCNLEGGGAIVAFGNKCITKITGSTFTENSAISSSKITTGGAILSMGNAISIADSTFIGNVTDSIGGAIHNKQVQTGTASIIGSTFSGNTAGISGGAIGNEVAASISSSMLTGNTAGNHGGAIFNDITGTADISGSTFSGNTAGTKGGAVFNKGSVCISGSSFNRNMAVFGGAFSNDQGNVSISGSTFTGNTASSSGGAIFNKGGSVSISGSTFTGNTASESGGAIYNVGGGSVSISGSTFTGNTAKNGGAIFNEGGVVSICNSIFSGNDSGLYGSICNYKGTVNFTGEVTLGTAKDTIYNNGTLNWDLTGAATGSLNGYQWLNNNDGKLKITVSAEQPENIYILATGDFGNITGKDTFSITGVAGQSDQTITIDGDTVIYSEIKYTLYTSGDKLLLRANPLPFRRFIVRDTETITLPDKTYTNPEVYAGDGGAGEVQAGGVLIGNTVSISGNTAAGNGGAFINAGTADISGSTLTGNTADESGGAIFNKGGSVSISGSTLTGNTADERGGAIFNKGGSVSISGSTFTENSSEYSGGAIYNEAGGTVSISSSTFTENSSKNFGGAIFNEGSVSISDSSFTGNKARDGGNVIYNGAGGSVSISGSTFTGSLNSILNSGGVVNICNSMFSGNYNYSYGTICNYNAGTVNFTGEVTLGTENDTIYTDATLNWDLTGTATGKLNGYQWLRNNGGKLKITVSAEQTENIYILATGDFRNITGKDTFTITGVAGQSDQTITIDGDAVNYNGIQYTLCTSGDKLLLCAAALSFRRFIVRDAETITLPGKTYTNPEVYAGNGGAGEVQAGGVLIGNTVSISGNTIAGNGGAFTNAGTAGISGSTLSGNTAGESGGAIDNAGTASISGSTFTGNSAELYGGAIYNKAGTAGIGNSIFIENVAGGSGGAIANTGTVCISGSTLSGNTAGGSGGAIANTGTVSISGSTLSGNTAGGSGGAIANTGTVSISGSTLSGNTAGGNGGAVCNDIAGTACISGSTFTGNSAEIYGGAIFNKAGTAGIGNSIFIGNVAGGSGGAIFNKGGSVSISSSTLTGNTAGKRGGAIFNKGGSVSISGSTFTENSSEYSGGAIYNEGGGSVSISGSTFTENSSEYSGGAIYNEGGGSVSISSSTFTENSSKNFGGAIYNGAGGSVSISDSSFTGNKARDGGAVIYNGAGGSVSISGSTFTESLNSILNSGGVVNICNSMFSGNYNYSYGTICNYNAGVVNFTGEVTLGTEQDTIYTDATLNWDLTGTTIGKLNGYQWLRNNGGKLKITVSATQPKGTYVLATGDFTTTTDKDAFTITGVSGQSDQTITIGGFATYNGITYQLYTSENQLILNSFDRFIVTASNSPYTLEAGTTCTNPEVYAGNGGKGEVHAGGVLIGNTVSISGNTAAGYGGAFINAGTAVISGSTLSENIAGESGGAICNDIAGTVSISESRLSGNTAFIGGAIDNDGTVSISGSTLSGNTADIFGGAIANAGTVSISESRFSNNTALFGGVIDNDGTVSISGSTLAGNTADFFGGAIVNTGTVSISGSAFELNKSYDGGAFMNQGGIITVDDSIFSENFVSDEYGNGGAIYNFDNGIVNISGSTFYGNVASGVGSLGGAVYNASGSTVSITGTTFYENFASEGGGAIYNDQGTVNFNGEVTLATPDDTIYNSAGGTLNWDLTGTTTGKLNGYQYISNDGNLTITVKEETENKSYLIATGDFSDLPEKLEFTLTGLSCPDVTITAGSSTVYGRSIYHLAVNEGRNELVLSCESTASTLYVNSDYIGKYGDETSDHHFIGIDAFSEYSSNELTGVKKVWTQSSSIVQTGGTYSEVVSLEGHQLQINGGTINSMLTGGDSITGVCGNWNFRRGSTSITVKDGTFRNFYGADIVSEGSALRTGDVTLNISGGSFALGAYGGMFFRTTGRDVATYENDDVRLKGNINFTISGGTFANNVCGGNASVDINHATYGNASEHTTVDGNITLTLDATNGDLSFRNSADNVTVNVFAGSVGYGVVTGNTKVVVTGVGTIDIEGALSGGSGADYVIVKSDGKRTVHSNVFGHRELSFTNFWSQKNADEVQTLSCRIFMFDTMKFEDNTKVEFTYEDNKFNDVKKWSFEKDCFVDFGDAQNSFEGDTLNFTEFDFAAGEQATILTGKEAALADFDHASAVNINGIAAKQWKNGWSTSEYFIDIVNTGVDNKSNMVITRIA